MRTERWWSVTVWELEDGRLVIGGESDGPDWLAWCRRLKDAVDREIAWLEGGSQPDDSVIRRS